MTTRHRRRPRSITALVLAVLAAALSVAIGGCAIGSSGPGATGSDGRITVVATSTVFGDLVAQVGGDAVSVTSLVPRGTDVHTFAPRPNDLRRLADARLIVMNGLGLDDWLVDLIRTTNPDAPLVRLAVDLPGVEALPGDRPGAENPHLWLSVPYARGYAARIADALRRSDPSRSNYYTTRAGSYDARLVALDEWVRVQVATIPAANRRIVTFHDAFPYFAREYGLEIVGVAVQAPGQEPSAAETAALVDAIRAAGVRAIFAEDQFPTKLVDQLAAETGATVVADLYDDSLGDPPVSSYEDLIRWDVSHVVDALQ